MTRTIAVLLILARVAAAEELPGADEALYSCKKRTAAVQVSFKPEVELKELLAWAVGFTCKQIVYDPRIITHKVTMMIPEAQTPQEAYELFVVALSTIGYTVVPKGKTLRIVESATAVGETVPIYAKGVPPGDAMVRYLIRPVHAQPDALGKALTAMKSKDGNVTPLGSSLVVTDYASNVRDMLKIKELVDVPGGSEGIYTIAVQHAEAAKLADKLTTLLAAPKDAPPSASAPSKILVDERTNTLILAASAAAYERVSALVQRLDIALDIEGGTAIHVYQLGSAVADELAKTLNDAIQNAAQKPAAGSAPAPAAKPEGSLALEGQARVIADAPTNKLVVMSSGRDFLAIRDVIRELDVPRRQVFIEANIVEVEVSNELALGVSSHGGMTMQNGETIGLGGVQTSHLRSLDLSTLTTATGLVGGVVGKMITGSSSLLGKNIPSYTILFQALGKDGRTNVLATPSITVVDNELGKFKAGTDVPYKKGVMPTSPVSTSTVTTNIDRKQLVLELDVKPHISANDGVLLEIKLSSDDPGDLDPELGPKWTTRAFETRVLVHDQQTIVISGLMQEREITSSEKVPLLGDIPILGYLFKYKTREKKKTNLLVTLTPYIIKSDIDLELVRERKERERDEFIGSIHSLDGMKFQPRVDYRRKRGLVEEINRAVQDVEADTAARATLKPPARVEGGLVE